MQGATDRVRSIRAWCAGGLAGVCASLLIAASPSLVAAETTALFPLAPGAHAHSMTVGPDGTLWFAGARNKFGPSEGVIGHIAPDGKATEFTLPLPPKATEYGYPQSIAAGPDGNLWFTRPQLQKVGRISPGGGITEFVLPSGSDGKPETIVTGPDGNLWFTEGPGDAIGRITPSGEITEFALRPSRRPAGIVAGPDSSMWFTERGADRIGRITTAGEITEFPLPKAANQRPNAIAAGPDGNLWFTESGASRIGRITPAGAIAEFPVPAINGTGAIAAGPRGEVWFTSLTGISSISSSGRVTPSFCVDSFCHLPPLSLMAGVNGELRVGTANAVGGGGGGYTTMLAAVNEPGYVAIVAPPPPPTTLIGPRARPVAGRLTDVNLRCEAAAGCSGVLRLVRPVPSTGRRQLLGQAPYSLAAGAHMRIPVRLRRPGAERLADRGSLLIWAIAGAAGKTEAIQSMTLRRHASHKRSPAN
jgi:virginiamycin B lyase